MNNKSWKNEKRLLQAELKDARKKLKFHNNIIKNLAATSDLKKSLTPIMDNVKAITGAKAWSVVFNDEPYFEIIPLKMSKRIQKKKFKKGEGIAGWVMENEVPVNVKDVSKEKRFNAEIDRFANVKIRTFICAPMMIKQRISGVIRLINKDDNGFFTDDDMQQLEDAARYAGIAVERTFLYQKIKNDDLTNLFNIRYLHQAVGMEIERARRYNFMLSLIFLDLDNFKKVNDKYGHLVGSRVLIEIAQILQKNLRKIDVITRYGGDEFVMILPQTPRDASFQVAERLRKVIAKNVFLKSDGYSIKLTASLGVASFPDNAKTKEELLKIADEAMYRGKFSTKNIVYVAK